MLGCFGQPRPAQEDVVARALAAVALAALAVIHVVDLPGTLGPTPLIGIGGAHLRAGQDRPLRPVR